MISLNVACDTDKSTAATGHEYLYEETFFVMLPLHSSTVGLKCICVYHFKVAFYKA